MAALSVCTQSLLLPSKLKKQIAGYRIGVNCNNRFMRKRDMDNKIEYIYIVFMYDFIEVNSTVHFMHTD